MNPGAADTFSRGERVRAFGRPWGKSRAPAKWRYGTALFSNLTPDGDRYPVALLSESTGADYTGEAYVVEFTPGGGALWYKSDELRKVRTREVK